MEGAYIESKKLLDAGMSLKERQLRPRDFQFPIQLRSVADLPALISALRSAQEAVGSTATTGHGNSTRRVLFTFSTFSVTAESGQLDYLLAFGARKDDGHEMGALGPLSTEEVYDGIASNGPATDFDPEGYEKARRTVLVALAQRQGQPKFRQALMEAYGHRCAITGCDLEEALEAAHIVAYYGPGTNHVQNGLLLRADLHTLFDKGLIGVCPASWRVKVRADLLTTHYRFLAEACVRLPIDERRRPSAEALWKHLRGAGLG